MQAQEGDHESATPEGRPCPPQDWTLQGRERGGDSLRALQEWNQCTGTAAADLQRDKAPHTHILALLSFENQGRLPALGMGALHPKLYVTVDAD